MGTSDRKAFFGKFDFDERLQRVIAEMGWEKPTPVQVEMIPLMLNDKNILARARTGSGKTAAFLLPLIQKILHLTTNKSNADEKNGPFAMIVAPTKELATQIFDQLEKLIAPFPFIQCFNLAQYIDSHDHTLGNELLDIIIGTPIRLLATSAKTPDIFKRLHCVILDEADLLFSYGYQDEIKRLKFMLPTKYQTVMTSATLNEDLSQLKRNFVVGKVVSLKLKETDLPGLDQLEQFYISCKNDEERFTIFLALIKLKLLVGKSVIFVSSIDRCYKLHLFLQSFNVHSAVLNAQMPANSRCRIIHEFNQGRWPFLIASECNDIFDESGEDQTADNQTGEIKDEKEKTKKEKRKEIKRKSKHHQIDKESGTGRGIDFYLVPNVVNFDFPISGDMYVHRVGRTARGYNKGTAISFSTEDEQKLFEQIKEEIDQRMGMPVIKPYEIRIKDFEPFQLRARDVLAACTRTAIREIRITEIREEILQSRRLDSYFAKNPRERWMLEQDRKKFKLNLHSPGIADVPDYIVPKALRGQNFNSGELLNAFPVNRRKRMGQPNGATDEEGDGLKQKKYAKKHKFLKGTAKHKFQKQMSDPLRSFKF